MQHMESGEPEQARALQVGQRVHLRHDRQRRGVVRAWAPRAQGGFRYQVALATDDAVGDVSPWYIEEDLEPLASEAPCWLSRDEFLRELLLIKLRHPLTDTLYEYRASRTDFLPYQYIPALKFLENPDRRILIADEVGLGKTIEACIIYRELEARYSLNGVLVVCPSALRRKWQDELSHRYDEHFDVLDSKDLRGLLEEHRNPFGRKRFRSIISYATLRRQEHIKLIRDTEFRADMIIFDEAHHMRNKKTNTYKVAWELLKNSSVAEKTATVLLSATPLQTNNENLFNLVNLLMDEEYKSLDEFKYVIEPNQLINNALRQIREDNFLEARRQLEKANQNPYFAQVQDHNGNQFISLFEKLRDLDKQTPPDRRKAIQLQRDVQELNTLSDIFSRTRKRDVEEIAEREAESIVVEPTDREREFYNSILSDAREEFRRRGIKAIAFAAVTRERMAASCLPVMREHCLRKLSGELLAEDSIYDVFSDDSQNSGRREDSLEANTALERRYSCQTRQLARQLGELDSKLGRLLEVITHELDRELSRNTEPAKILLFATYRGTLEYLHKMLKPLFEERRLHYDVIHGGIGIAERHQIIENFREDRNFRLLLSSNVGGEGLDFQFSEVLINYDMPWNPMTVEQRIGRLDRIGQERDKIRIFNFYMDKSIDTRILKRLHERIKLFHQSIGDLEEILGEVVSELSREMFTRDLRPDQQRSRAIHAADRILREEIDREKLEKKADQLLGNQEVINARMAEQKAGGRIIHAEEVRASVQAYLAQEFPSVRMEAVADTTQWQLNGSPDLVDHISGYRDLCLKRREVVPPVSKGFLEGLTDRRRVRRITFHSEEAQKESKQSLEFISHHHALAQLARDFWHEQYDGSIPALGGMVMKTDDNLSSDNYYFLFVIEETGLRERRILIPVLIGDDGMNRKEEAELVLGKLHELPKDTPLPANLRNWEKARESVYEIMDFRRDQREKEIRERNTRENILERNKLMRRRDREIARYKDLLAQVADPGIRRIYEVGIRKAKQKYENETAELNKRNTVSVSYELVATGRVRLVPLGAPSSMAEDAWEGTLVGETEGTSKTAQAKTKAPPLSKSRRRKMRRARKRKRRQG